MPPKRKLKPRSRHLGSLGEAITQAREEAGLSLEQLAEKSHLHPTHVGGLERGARNPTYSTLVQIADGLETTPGALAVAADRIFAEKRSARDSKTSRR